MAYKFIKKNISSISDNVIYFRLNSFTETGRFYESCILEVADLERKQLYSNTGNTLEDIKFEIYRDLIEFMNQRDKTLYPLLYVTVESTDFWPIMFKPRKDFFTF